MNMKLKRLICLVLVFCLILTMPGCATIDGRSVSLFEALLYIVDAILQITILVVGELALLVVFLVIDVLMSAIESVTGGEWWDVEEVGGPIMRGYIRLVDPKGRFGTVPEEEVNAEPTVSATEPQETEPAVTGGLPQTGEPDTENLPAPEEQWGRYTIVFDSNRGAGVVLDQLVWKFAVYLPDFLAPKLTEDIPIRTGCRFIGWGRTPDATEIAYVPGQSLRGLDSSMYLYAMWEECGEHTYFIDTEWHDMVRCKDCNTPMPLDQLKFSVFRELYTQRTDLDKKVRQSKESALNAYILTKMWMTKNELNDAIKRYELSKKQNLTCFEMMALTSDEFVSALETVTLQNTEAFFESFIAMYVVVDCEGIENLAGRTITALDDANTVASAFKFVGESMEARNKAKNYKAFAGNGPEDTYYTEEAYRELVVANARSVTALIGFISNFTGMFSLGVPLPDADALIGDLEELAELCKLRNTYEVLSRGLIGGKTISYIMHNDMMNGVTVKGTFKELNYATKENIEAAMREGPSAKDTLKVINDILSRESALGKDRAKVAAALWYYYGWRWQVDYEDFVNKIYNDLL